MRVPVQTVPDRVVPYRVVPDRVVPDRTSHARRWCWAWPSTELVQERHRLDSVINELAHFRFIHGAISVAQHFLNTAVDAAVAGVVFAPRPVVSGLDADFRILTHALYRRAGMVHSPELRVWEISQSFELVKRSKKIFVQNVRAWLLDWFVRRFLRFSCEQFPYWLELTVTWPLGL